jgi:hypothetical protein
MASDTLGYLGTKLTFFPFIASQRDDPLEFTGLSLKGNHCRINDCSTPIHS